jgi:uncharacterized membrane protein YfhO
MSKQELQKPGLAGYFKNPLPAIGRFFDERPAVWLSFAIAFVGLLFAYIVFEVWPFGGSRPDGGRSVLCLDLNAQYVYYFIYMRDALFGPESVLYSWSRNMSGEFVGIIGYYLFSPFNLIVWAFPISHVTEGLMLMLLCKIGAIAACMAVYLHIWRKFSAHTTVLFSVMYALCSFSIVQTMNPMWLDGVMALPLVITGIEALLKQGKYKLLVFGLVYSFITCFYIGYMIAIFAALYFVYYALTSRRCTRENLLVMLKRAGLFAGVAVVSGAMAAFILLPVYASLSLGKLEFTNPDYSINNNFTIMEITRKLFFNSYDTVRMDGQPWLFSGTVALIMLPAYFFCGRIRRTRRLGGVLLIAIMTYSMLIKPVDMFWHGGQVPNWLPYRYSFIVSFLFIAFGAEAFEYIRKIPRKVIGTTAGALAVLLIYWENTDTFVPDLGSNGRELFDWFQVGLPAMGLVLLFAGYMILARDKLNRNNMFAAVLIALSCMEMSFNAQFQIQKQNTDIVYSTRESFESMIHTRAVTDEINAKYRRGDEYAKGLFRMEKTYMRSANDPMALRMNGFTHSSSMLNADAIQFLAHMGYSNRGHATRYSGATPVTNHLFGFRYVLHAPNRDRAHGSVKSPADITVEEIPDTMPIAYLVSPDVQSISFEKDRVFRNQTELMSYMLGERGNEYFVRTEWLDRRPENVNFKQMGDGYSEYERITAGQDAHIQYDMVAEKAGEFFMYFPSGYERRSNLWVRRYADNWACSCGNRINSGKYCDQCEEVCPNAYWTTQFIGQVYETDHHHIHRLGEFEEGEEFMVTLSLTGEKVFFRDQIFMRLDRELFDADIARLHANNHSDMRRINNRHLRITTGAQEEMLLFTSIPAEGGWTATLNGKRVEIVEICGGLIGVNVPAGSHTVDLKFFPNQMPLGLCLTAAGIFGLVGLILLMGSLKARRKTEPSPAYLTDDYNGIDPDYIDLDSDDEMLAGGLAEFLEKNDDS